MLRADRLPARFGFAPFPVIAPYALAVIIISSVISITVIGAIIVANITTTITTVTSIINLSIVIRMLTLLDLCVSSVRRGHANILCIVQILPDDPRREST